ncbi:MAG: hypothetical protein WEB04_01395 [Dehalococcoidia bacterium]
MSVSLPEQTWPYFITALILLPLVRWKCIEIAEGIAKVAFWFASLGIPRDAKDEWRQEALYDIVELIGRDRARGLSREVAAYRATVAGLNLLINAPGERSFYISHVQKRRRVRWILGAREQFDFLRRRYELDWPIFFAFQLVITIGEMVQLPFVPSFLVIFASYAVATGYFVGGVPSKLANTRFALAARRLPRIPWRFYYWWLPVTLLTVPLVLMGVELPYRDVVMNWSVRGTMIIYATTWLRSSLGVYASDTEQRTA